MRTLLLVLVSVVVIVFCWAVMLATDLDKKLLDQDFIEEIEETVQLSQIASQKAPDLVAEELPDTVPPVVKEQLPIAFAEVFDESWFKNTLLSASEDLMDTIAGEQESITTVIDIREEKQLMFEQLMEQLGELSYEELYQGGIQLPPGADVSMAAPQLEGPIMDGFPDEFVLSEFLADADLPMSITEIQSQRQSLKTWYIVSLLVLIPVFIVLYILLAGTHGALRWSGITLFIAGAVYLIGIFIFRGSVVSMVSSLELPLGLDPTAFEPAVKIAFQKFIASPIICAIIGIIFAAASYFLPKDFLQRNSSKN